jgi:hypothetical protein
LWNKINDSIDYGPNAQRQSDAVQHATEDLCLVPLGQVQFKTFVLLIQLLIKLIIRKKKAIIPAMIICFFVFI